MDKWHLRRHGMVTQSDLIKSGFAISTHNRLSRGGGITLLYKDHIETQHLHTIEYATWQVSLKNITITILGICHLPPKQNQTNTTFLDEITKLLTSKLPNIENAIILGDFNMHIEDLTDNSSPIFVDIMEVLGLQQHVNQPIHQKKKHLGSHIHWSHIKKINI